MPGLLVLIGCTTPTPIPDFESRDLAQTGFPELPRDAAEVAERAIACIHFGGELSGDGSERDVQVQAELRDLRCDSIDQDVAAMRKNYASNKTVQAGLDAATR